MSSEKERKKERKKERNVFLTYVYEIGIIFQYKYKEFTKNERALYLKFLGNIIILAENSYLEKSR